jgi:hypothetical protein
MEISKTHENFPVWIVIQSNLVAILIYISGFLITLRLTWIAAGLYLVFILALEYRLLSKHCINCYYWGKTCGFGKGRLSSVFFKRGDPSGFCAGQFSWKDLIPDLLVSLIPLLIAIVLMIISFDLVLLVAAILLIFLTTYGNNYIRRNLTCGYCKQRELGCPAEKLFSTKSTDVKTEI